MAGLHALFAPSSAARWMRCIGSTAAIKKAKVHDEPSEYAAEGTVAHSVAADCLTNDTDAEKYVGEIREADGFKFTVDDDMASFVQVYVDAIRNRPGEKMIEETLDLSDVYGVENQFGTSDATVLNFDEEMLETHDLKFGRGVQVFAANNEQGLSYAAGVYELYQDMADWKKIKIAIHQPRIDHYDEWVITIDELKAFITKAKTAAQQAASLLASTDDHIAANLTAGDKQCQWCPLKGSCAVLTKYVHESVFELFDIADGGIAVEQPKTTATMGPGELAASLERLDLINSWVSEVRAEGLRRVSTGLSVPGWKLVAGKKGARAWRSDDEAEAIMKAARLKTDDMYNKKLITAPQAEKVLKKRPKIWDKLSSLITQADGKPGLAPEADKRPALAIAAQFEDVSDDFSDLI